eukprot:scaffold63368_cov37-Tisochrysis_lutea.AAC.1
MKPAGLMQPLQLSSRRWEHFTMDFITHLPKTHRQNDAIMVFIDKLFKYVRFAPTTTDVTSWDAAHILQTGWCLFLVSLKSSSQTETLDSQDAFSTAFHPQIDGQTEKYNSVLEDMLRHY